MVLFLQEVRVPSKQARSIVMHHFHDIASTTSKEVGSYYQLDLPLIIENDQTCDNIIKKALLLLELNSFGYVDYFR